MTSTEASPRLEAALCLVGADCAGVETAADALRALAERAVAEQFAEPSFVEAVLAREETYPTGLPLPVPAAIPHTDAVHVRRPALAALVPPRPLTFGEMGSKDRTVEAELVVMLLVDDPAEQVPLLGRLIRTLQAGDLRERLLVGVADADDLSRRFALLMSEA